MATTFKGGLVVAARVTLVVAVIAFAVTSFVTTFKGFQSFLPLEVAFVAAFGLQLTLTATEIFYAQADTARGKFIAFATFLFVIALSITFSYVGLREIFSKHLAERRDPIYELNEFKDKRTQLHQDAMTIKGAALEYFDNLKLDVSTEADIASKDENTRRLIAQDLRRRIAENEARGVATARLRSQLIMAEAKAENLRFEGTKLGNKKDQLVQRKHLVEDYAPAIVTVRDNDWSALNNEHQKLGEIWGKMPDDFRKDHQLPPAPTKSVFRDGKIAEGQDHPTIEAINSITRPQPHEKFALMIAALLDVIPFVAVLMTQGRKKSFNKRLANLRRWMKEVKVQVELMDGVFHWLWKVFVSFFFRRAFTNDDPRVVAFRKLLNEMKAEMEDFLQQASLPQGIAELLRLKLTDLYSQSHEIAFEASARLNESVLRTYESCLDEIENDGLDEDTKLELRKFLSSHMERFDAAVRTASFSETN